MYINDFVLFAQSHGNTAKVPFAFRCSFGVYVQEE